ncbi:hypothetical protein CEXT_278851 [Caerostris extrusa]|uniref:Uncharacterized protein n=1 Tax=Caerostris extrusa TaxID=172846 RepID=A0AAV4NIK0_CAEEX|nr:hypothetical protein CEXT_278851 [Caerostris extrusa]
MKKKKDTREKSWRKKKKKKARKSRRLDGVVMGGRVIKTRWVLGLTFHRRRREQLRPDDNSAVKERFNDFKLTRMALLRTEMGL